MSRKQQPSKPSREPIAPQELDETSLAAIAGGDKASPVLQQACAGGKHIPEVTIHF